MKSGDFHTFSGFAIQLQNDSLHFAGGVVGNLEPGGEISGHPADDVLRIDPQNGADGSGHSQVGNVPCPFREDRFIGGLDMGVGPRYG